ncbi:MAG: peptidylprolyl isomerase, partial [Planctomycetota bacterium]
SQFFICLTREHCQHLDGQYTGFGQVTEGMDVVEALGATKVDQATGAPKDPPVLLGVQPIE